MQRMAMVIGVAPERIADYKLLHDEVWPDVLARIRRSGISNYSIFLREPENLLFGYWEYEGGDFAADMAAIAADPETQRWWSVCDPCQVPLASRGPSEHWATLEQVFHLE